MPDFFHRQLTCQRNCTFVLRRISPFKHTNIGVQWEWLGRILQSNLTLVTEQVFVNVGMRLQLNATLIIVGQEDFDSAELVVGDAQCQQTGKFKLLQATVTANSDVELVFDSQMDAKNSCVN